MLLSIIGCSSNPKSGGIKNGKLLACPNTRNCVSSQNKNANYLVAPFFYNKGVPEQKIMGLLSTVIGKFNTKIIKQSNNYLWVEFKTPLGFIDDVEFYIGHDYQVIQFRSISRVGSYDFGKNKKRYREILALLTKYEEFINPEDIKLSNKILDFWFQNESNWFKKSDYFDDIIKAQFLAVHNLITKNKFNHWKSKPQSLLAMIIALDQFSRNMFRDTQHMFRSDKQALSLAKFALEKNWDKEFDNEKYRTFFYMPLMHSESIEDQSLCIKLFEESTLKQSLEFAKKHRDIIAKFGRFPHRNNILGRVSTPEEIEFLKQEGSSF
jgi:uncharacterized protein (DUF924 family)/uncharacterized protein (DUF1499 family)